MQHKLCYVAFEFKKGSKLFKPRNLSVKAFAGQDFKQMLTNAGL